MPQQNNSIDYIEFPLKDSVATKTFYSQVFEWEFQDWGESYLSFTGAGIDGGFNDEQPACKKDSGVLAILYADDLPAKLKQVQDAGAEITRDIFEFPGGRRFHFLDPNGNELAIWTKAEEA